jgi:hypothetical protein
MTLWSIVCLVLVLLVVEEVSSITENGGTSNNQSTLDVTSTATDTATVVLATLFAGAEDAALTWAIVFIATAVV